MDTIKSPLSWVLSEEMLIFMNTSSCPGWLIKYVNGGIDEIHHQLF